MVPLLCPHCKNEVLPHETHIQRWEQCLQIFADEKYSVFSWEDRIKMAINFFNELNDFIISENISRDKMKTTQQIQKYKTENIKKLNNKGE